MNTPDRKEYILSQDSKDTLKKRGIVVMIVMILIFVLAFSPSLFKNPASNWVFLLLVSIYAVLFFWICKRQATATLRNLLDRKLIISQNEIECVSGMNSKKIMFNDVKKIDIRRDPKKNVLYITLNSAKEKMDLYGFENMEDTLQQIKEKTRERIPITERTRWLHWENPAFLFIFLAGFVVLMNYVMAFLRGNLPDKTNNLLWAILYASFGCYLIFFKVVSRSYIGSYWRRYEILVGLCCILLAAITLFN